MMRALRCDKLTYAALGATLQHYRKPDQLCEQIPVLRMMRQSHAAMRPCAHAGIGYRCLDSDQIDVDVIECWPRPETVRYHEEL